jgi:hypothetical protein
MIRIIISAINPPENRPCFKKKKRDAFIVDLLFLHQFFKFR